MPSSSLATTATVRRCSQCWRPLRYLRVAPPPAVTPRVPANARAASSSSQSRPPPLERPARRGFYLPLSLLAIPLLWYFAPSAPPSLSPQSYSSHPLTSTTPLSSQHKLLTIPVKPADLAIFSEKAARREGTPISNNGVADAGELNGSPTGSGSSPGEIMIQHVMLKNPDLQIERPYTPVNDVVADGEMRLVVKRVKGGEVGRLVHSLKPGDDVGIRGPITTFSIVPFDYDKIVMISSGTGIAPFLQLLSKIATSVSPHLLQSSPIPPAPLATSNSASPTSLPRLPRLHLIQSLPQPDRPDWATTSRLLPDLQDRLGPTLVVHRVAPGSIDRQTVETALGRGPERAGERVLVLVCLPPPLLRPLCGPFTPSLQQGQITGVLGDLGLTNAEVWKLE